MDAFRRKQLAVSDQTALVVAANRQVQGGDDRLAVLLGDLLLPVFSMARVSPSCFRSLRRQQALEAKMRALIRADAELYKRVLIYDPLDIDSFWSRLKGLGGASCRGWLPLLSCG